MFVVVNLCRGVPLCGCVTLLSCCNYFVVVACYFVVVVCYFVVVVCYFVVVCVTLLSLPQNPNVLLCCRATKCVTLLSWCVTLLSWCVITLLSLPQNPNVLLCCRVVLLCCRVCVTLLSWCVTLLYSNKLLRFLFVTLLS